MPFLKPPKTQCLSARDKRYARKMAEQDGTLRMAAGQAFYNTSEFTLAKPKASSQGQRLHEDFLGPEINLLPYPARDADDRIKLPTLDGQCVQLVWHSSCLKKVSKVSELMQRANKLTHP